MTVDKLGDNKLLIKLDESDMENFELDFGKMSLKNNIICSWILTLHAIFLSVFPKMKLILHKMQWCS